MNQHQLSAIKKNENKYSLAINPIVIKQDEYNLEIVSTSCMKLKGDIKDAKKIDMNEGGVILFKGTRNDVILATTKEKVSKYETQKVETKYWSRKILQRIKMHFIDEQQNARIIRFYVGINDVDAIIKKIDKKIKKDVDNAATYDIEDIEDLGNIKDAKKIVIIPIELGNFIQFRGIENDIILRIPMKNILYVTKAAQIVTKHWPRKVIDLEVKIHYVDEKQEQKHDKIICFNVEDRCIDTIIKKISMLKDVDNHRYWTKICVSYKRDDSIKTAIILPETPFLGEGEKILWANKKLDEITNGQIVRLRALTNFRVFEYDFQKHKCHYVLLTDVEDIILTNKKSIPDKRIETGNHLALSEATIVADLTFINKQKPEIVFNEINDPEYLINLLTGARLGLIPR
jgi:hypothetical protein